MDWLCLKPCAFSKQIQAQWVFASKIAGTQLSPRCYHRFSHTSSPKRTALEMKQPRASSAIQLLMFDFESAEIDAISRWHHTSGLLRLALLPQGRVRRAADGEPFACHTHRISLRTPSCASSVERSTILRWGETLEDSTHKLNVFFAFVLVSASDTLCFRGYFGLVTHLEILGECSIPPNWFDAKLLPPKTSPSSNPNSWSAIS